MSGVQGQMIGAVAKDPRAQAAAASAARDPQVQAAAWRAAQEAARRAAPDPSEGGGAFLAGGAGGERVSCSVRAWCFATALALLVFSVLGMANVFNAAFHPLQYLFGVYNIIFAIVIIIVEGEQGWFKRLFDLQGRLFGAAPCLASRAGRAVLYFYVGSINLFMLPESWIWKIIYLCIGGCLCGAGLLMLVDRCMDRCARGKEPQPPHVTV